MHKFEKKLIAILISLAFLTSGVVTASAISIEKPKIKELKENISESSLLLNKVLIYRHGLDGTITPVKIDLELEDEQDIGEAIIEKLDELLDNDQEIQDLMQLLNFTIDFGVRIKSRGKGVHFQTLFFEKILIKFILFRLGLPRIAPICAKTLLFCKYLKDEEAKTTIKFLYGFGETTEMKGKHTVIVRNFIGYTTWFRSFSITPFNILPRAFSGYARLVFCRELI